MSDIEGQRAAGHGGRIERGVVAGLMLLMVIVPGVEFVLRRWFHSGIPGASDYLQHFTLWAAFLGAGLTAAEGRHLRISGALEFLPARVRGIAERVSLAAAGFICWILAAAGLQLVLTEAPALPAGMAEELPDWLSGWIGRWGLFVPGTGTTVATWIPTWVAEAVMPLGLGVTAVRFMRRATGNRYLRLVEWLGIPLALLIVASAGSLPAAVAAWGIVALVVLAIFGLPVFVLLGGAAWLLFWCEGVTIAAIPAEAYRIVISPVFPAIPIFTLAGYILSESRASRRLVRVFEAVFGWIPGGSALVVTLLCAFFTTFTGASGITILALGGLLLPVLKQSGFGERFSVGLITATGSIGLLLPPSLVVILFGVIAHVPIVDLFKAALVPGALMVGAVAGMCVWEGRRRRVKPRRFQVREAAAALKGAVWELLIPVVALAAIFGGFCTLIEAAGLTALYALVVEIFIYRDIGWEALGHLLVKSGVLVGGVLIVLGMAMGLTSYLVDAQVPMHAAAWVQAHVHARWLFLLGLNGALVLVGCLMDIFSALVVVVPLILPMARVFGVDPVHLGVIFLANLQLGYLTPPVGMNLFLAAFRFEIPLLRVGRYALPFLLILGLIVLLVTYVPGLSLGVMRLL